MKERNLEERLRTIPDSANLKFVSEATHPRINPAENFREMPYLKYDLVNAIGNYFRKGGINLADSFERDLYSSQLNKDPLKRTYYGMLSAKNVPQEVINSLDNKFELVYLYAGIWERASVNENNPIHLNVAITLNTGLNCLYKHHYIRKAEGKYSREIKLPKGKEIREVCQKFIEEQKQKLANPILIKKERRNQASNQPEFDF